MTRFGDDFRIANSTLSKRVEEARIRALELRRSPNWKSALEFAVSVPYSVEVVVTVFDRLGPEKGRQLLKICAKALLNPVVVLDVITYPLKEDG